MKPTTRKQVSGQIYEQDTDLANPVLPVRFMITYDSWQIAIYSNGDVVAAIEIWNGELRVLSYPDGEEEPIITPIKDLR